MGGTFFTYGEPAEHDVLRHVWGSLPGNVTKADLIRMGLSEPAADKAIAQVGHGGGSVPPGGYVGGGGDGSGGFDRHHLRYAQIHASAPPDAQIDERVFDRMISAGTPIHLMAEIQRQLDHCRQQVIKPNQKAEKLDRNLRNLENKELEIDVALYFGRGLMNFGQQYDKSGNVLPRTFGYQPHVEVDVETSEFLIEVTTRAKRKDKQIGNYLSINCQQKDVILYAPNYGIVPGKNLTERTGVKIARSKGDLFNICQKLRLEKMT